MRQNNTIDIYEEYFSHDDRDWSGEPPSAKGLAVFRDPNAMKRTATSIHWHPEGPTKIAVSYSILNFQDSRFTSARSAISVYRQSYWPNSAATCKGDAPTEFGACGSRGERCVAM